MVTKKLPKYVTKSEIQALLKGCEGGYNIERNKLIIWMLYTTGLRVSELEQLNTENLVKDGVVVDKFMICGKGNRERTIYLTDDTRKMIRKYLGMRINKKGALLNHSKTDRLKAPGIRKIVKNASIKSGVKIKNNGGYKLVTPHTLRHSYAVRLIQSDVPITAIQDLLGHENVNTTQIYTKLHNNAINGYVKNTDF